MRCKVALPKCKPNTFDSYDSSNAQAKPMQTTCKQLFSLVKYASVMVKKTESKTVVVVFFGALGFRYLLFAAYLCWWLQCKLIKARLDHLFTRANKTGQGKTRQS